MKGDFCYFFIWGMILIVLSFSCQMAGKEGVASQDHKVLAMAVKDKGPSAHHFQEANGHRYQQAHDLAIEAYGQVLKNRTILQVDSMFALNQLTYSLLFLDRVEARQALHQLEQLQPPKVQDSYPHLWADFLANKARSLYQDFQFDSALSYNFLAIRNYERLGYQEHLRLAQAFTLQALIFFETQPETDSCATYALRASNIFQNNPQLAPYSYECDFALAAMSLLGRAHERGELYARRAISKLAHLPFENPLLEARCWSMLGRMLKKQGDELSRKGLDEKGKRMYIEADSLCFLKAIALSKKTANPRIQEFYRDWIIHSVRFRSRDKFFSYLDRLDSVLLTQKDRFAHRDRLLGYYYFLNKELDSSQFYYERFLENGEKVGVETHLLDESNHVLKEIYQRKGAFDRAVQKVASRLEAYGCCPPNTDFSDEASLDSLKLDRSFCILKYAELASIFFQKYQRNQDFSALMLANKYYDKVEMAYFSTLPSADENAFLTYQEETGNKIFGQALQTAVESWEQTQDSFWLNRAFRYMEHIKSFLLYRNLKKETSNEASKWADSLRYYQGKVNQHRFQIKTTEEDHFAEWEAAQNVLMNLLRQKDKENILFAKNSQVKIPTLDKMQKGLKKDQAMLHFCLSAWGTYGLFLDQERTKLFKIEKQDSLSDDIQRLKDILQSKNPQQRRLRKSYLQAAHSLYNSLIAPIQPYLKKDQQLIIFPDGELDQLPFEVLLSKELPDTVSFRELPFLIGQVEILYSPSLKIYENNLNRTFDLKSIDRIGLWVDREVFSSFPEALSETNLNSQLNSYKNGKKATFLRDHGRYDLIHIIHHGRKNPVERSSSYIAFGPNVKDKLYGFELSSFDFRTQLMILAVCQSGSGPIEKGEGSFSMARAFMEAGIPQIISTLWNVNQESTDEILVNFYTFLKNGNTPSNALRKAKLAFIQNEVHPYMALPSYWGGLIMTQ